ncbi:MAG: type IV toxin-antitoxin system AbiEi family antitoxin domain-containing protein [Gammaproteobacteria bacterium]
MEHPSTQEILNLARRFGALRASDLEARGLPREYLSRLARIGLLERHGRGVYTLPGARISADGSLVQVATGVPDGVICLLSALAFHQLTTQLPSQVWLALPRGRRRPKLAYPPLRVMFVSEPAFSTGVEIHVVGGRAIQVYGVAKTIADCFKYRNKIGLDVTLEALNEAWTKRLFAMNELERHARINRVARVMRPYLEALVA